MHYRKTKSFNKKPDIHFLSLSSWLFELSKNSSLIQCLSHQDAEKRMPYKKDPLFDEDIDKLTKRVDQGAQWGMHWSYIPPENVTIPYNFGSDSLSYFLNNPIDHFILKTMIKFSLMPNENAERRTLARTVSFDVTGLPPGVDDTFIERRQVSSILITGPNIATGESYTIFIDNQANTVTSTAGDGPADIAQKLLTLINTQSTVVTASRVGSNLILTGTNNGVAFSVRSSKGSVPPAQLTFNSPNLDNSPFSLSITGTPTAAAVIAGQTSTTYPITCLLYTSDAADE